MSRTEKKLNGSTPHVRVFVGAPAAGEDAEACAVAEHGLRSRTSAPVDVEWLHLSRDQTSLLSGWRTERWSTPWTALRWAVPEMCGWEGRAVYLDCPTIVLGDAAELAAAPMPEGACVLARREGASLRTGCLVFDCGAARGRLPSIDALRTDVGAHQTVGHLLSSRPALVGDLPAGWGLRDVDFSRDPDAVTGSVHFAATALQPHMERAARRLARERRRHWFASARLPHYSARLVDLFEAEYAAATEAGYAPEQYVFEEDYGAYAISGAAVAERRERA